MKSHARACRLPRLGDCQTSDVTVTGTGVMGSALLSSPLTIMSVSDHEVARTLIEGVSQDLDGRVVASTSFVTPDQAQELGDVMRGAGVFLVSGGAAGHEHRLRNVRRAAPVVHRCFRGRAGGT